MAYRSFTLLAAGLGALYIAERTLHATPRLVVDAAACAGLALALALACARAARARAARRTAYLALIRAYAVTLAGCGVYAATLLPVADTWPERLRVALTVAWPAVVALGLLPALAMELAAGSMRRAPTLELWRVRLAARAARIMVLAAISFAGVNYAAQIWNRKLDLSYFRTAQLGGATQALVSSITAPLHVVLFFPPGNDVLEQARPYAEALAAASPQVSLEVLDQPLEPARARALEVQGNGYLVVATDAAHEAIALGLDAEDARATLRRLDAEVHRRLLKVLRPARVAYLASGHGERDFAPAPDDTRPGLGTLRTLLTTLNFSVRRLGLAEGLGHEVPSDATVVIVAGPTAAFAAAERAALQRYLTRGGRALIALDPDHGPSEDALLAPLGVRVGRALVASDRFRVRVEGQGESPYDMVTARASGHPATATLARAGGRYAFVVLGAGAVSAVLPAPPKLTVTMALHAMPGSWEDVNGNRRRDAAGEPAGEIALLAAVEGAAATAAAPSADVAKGPDASAAAGPAAGAPPDAAAPDVAKGPDASAAAGPAAGAPPDAAAPDVAKSPDASAAAGSAAGAPPDAAAPAIAAPAPTQLRAVIVGDADWLTDGVLGNPGNLAVASDSLRWLTGDADAAGAAATVESEADVPLVHRKEDDTLWFYGVSVLMPLATLALGLALSQRGARPRRRSARHG